MNRRYLDVLMWGLFILAFVAGPLRFKIPFFAGGTLLLCWFYLLLNLQRFKIVLLLYPFFFVISILLIYLLKSDFSGVGILWQVALVPVTAMGFFMLFLQRGDYATCNMSMWLGVAILLPFIFATLIAETGASRTLSGNARTFSEIAAAYQNRMRGVLDYGAIHSFPFLSFALFARYKQRQSLLSKFTFGFLCLLFVLVVCKSVFFAAIVVTFACLIMANTNARNIKIAVLGIILGTGLLYYLWVSGTIVALLNAVVNNLPGQLNADIVSTKVKQVTDYFFESKGFEGRELRYDASLNGFKNNFLIGGVSEHEYGGHSFILDILGNFGLCGFVAYLVYFSRLLRFIFRCIPPHLKINMCIMIVGFVFLGIIKNLAVNIEAVVLFGWAPLMYLWGRDDFKSAVFNYNRWFAING